VFYFKALFQNSPSETEQDQQRTQDSSCSRLDLNQELPEYKSEALPPRYKYFKAMYQFIGLLYPEG
jgi:hypothetical protein